MNRWSWCWETVHHCGRMNRVDGHIGNACMGTTWRNCNLFLLNLADWNWRRCCNFVLELHMNGASSVRVSTILGMHYVSRTTWTTFSIKGNVNVKANVLVSVWSLYSVFTQTGQFLIFQFGTIQSNGLESELVNALCETHRGTTPVAADLSHLHINRDWTCRGHGLFQRLQISGEVITAKGPEAAVTLS